MTDDTQSPLTVALNHPASGGNAEPVATAPLREQIAAAIDPLSFALDYTARHRHCSPYKIEYAQQKWFELADAVIALLIKNGHLASPPEGQAGGETTLHGQISAIYGKLDAEDCAWIDREWAKMRGYILPTGGTSTLSQLPPAKAATKPAPADVRAAVIEALDRIIFFPFVKESDFQAVRAIAKEAKAALSQPPGTGLTGPDCGTPGSSRSSHQQNPEAS